MSNQKPEDKLEVGWSFPSSYGSKILISIKEAKDANFLYELEILRQRGPGTTGALLANIVTPGEERMTANELLEVAIQLHKLITRNIPEEAYGKPA